MRILGAIIVIVVGVLIVLNIASHSNRNAPSASSELPRLSPPPALLLPPTELLKSAATLEGPKLRRDLAAETQHKMLMRNMDATVSAEGPSATTLHIRYVLAGAPMAEQMKTERTFLERCRAMGIKHVVLDNKFGKTWTFDL